MILKNDRTGRVLQGQVGIALGPLRYCLYELRLGLPFQVILKVLGTPITTSASPASSLVLVNDVPPLGPRNLPGHCIVADRAGGAFLYEVSTGQNAEHITDGSGEPLVVTNHQVFRHPTSSQMPYEALTPETNSFWRYETLSNLISAHGGSFTVDDINANNACVNFIRIQALLDGARGSRSSAGGPSWPL